MRAARKIYIHIACVEWIFGSHPSEHANVVAPPPRIEKEQHTYIVYCNHRNHRLKHNISALMSQLDAVYTVHFK